MEIEDGAYPLLDDIKMSLNSKDGLRNADVAVFIASYPHRPGMERSELLAKNSEIFKELGESVNSVASKDCKIIVVANPVNSLTTLLSSYAPDIPKENFTGLSRLDHNRAKFLMSKISYSTVDKVKKLIVWGNHSDTQYPDSENVTIAGVPVQNILKHEDEYLHTTYPDTIIKRWKKVVETRGITSIMSPANAIKDHLRDWYLGTEPDDYVSMAVIPGENNYGIPNNMCFSLPVVCSDFKYNIVKDIKLDDFHKKKILASIEEIRKELSTQQYLV